MPDDKWEAITLPGAHLRAFYGENYFEPWYSSVESKRAFFRTDESVFMIARKHTDEEQEKRMDLICV